MPRNHDSAPAHDRSKGDASRDEHCIIVGAGPIGIACALSARQHGCDPWLIDAGVIAQSIFRYPVRMAFFTTPELLEIGNHPLPCSGAKPTREEALKYYRGVVRNEQLRVSTHTRLVAGQRSPNGRIAVTLATEDGDIDAVCDKLVLATGYYDHPNRLGIPGENSSHVHNYYDEGHRHYGRDVVVIGGRNSAVEAALDLFRCGARVTLVYRGESFPKSVKYWLAPDIQNRIERGQIKAFLGSRVISIDSKTVHIETPRGRITESAHTVYSLVGYHPDFELFRRLGIELRGEELRPTHDPQTLQSNVEGIYLAGSVTAGTRTGQIFIENGRFDGEKIFGLGAEEVPPRPEGF